MSELKKAANGLKLIAIQTLDGCDEKYLNVLKPGEPYYFYSNYSIDPKSQDITVNSHIPASFYNVNNLKINLSAIVGKNGSGKSTVIELLLRLINNMSIRQRIPQMKFERLENLNVALYYYSDTFHKIEVIGTNVFYYTYDENGRFNSKARKNNKIKDFIYSIIVNFSHYAYNTTDYDEGDWLDELFHKNDGYQTPVVITPLRTKGNIEINTENQLVLARLIANFMAPSTDNAFNFRDVSNNLRATGVKLMLKKSKRKKELWRVKQKTKDKIYTLDDMRVGGQRPIILKKLDKLFPFKYEYADPVNDALALDYIIYKLISICLKYADYNEYFEKTKFKFKKELIDQFLEQLMSDSSHVTFKLRQMLNHLLFKEIKLESKFYTFEELNQLIKLFKKRHQKEDAEVIELLPPPIFSMEIVLETKQEPKVEVPFKKLSSGEKQILYSVSSFLYHLTNLNSVIETRKRRKYRYVNIVLEEAELYFHPEMQRTYVKYILDAIATMRLDKLHSLNICLVTHSPFVLSDIPKDNILFLQTDGEPADRKPDFATYGANIHDLLKQSFFLDKGAMGALAKSKINDTINYLNSLRLKREVEQLKDLSNNVKDQDLDPINTEHPLAVELAELEKVIVSRDDNLHEEMINLIDEPILKEKLSEMFDEYTGRNSKLRVIQDKIKMLQAQQAELLKKGGKSAIS